MDPFGPVIRKLLRKMYLRHCAGFERNRIIISDYCSLAYLTYMESIISAYIDSLSFPDQRKKEQNFKYSELGYK